MTRGDTAPVVRPQGVPLAVDDARFLRGSDGVAVRTFFWRPESRPRRRLLLLPGRAEFAEKYDETARELVARGFTVTCPEWRGQGLSDAGPLGDALESQRADLNAIRGSLFDGDDPDVILAHSMGGAHALALLAEDPTWAKALATTAPMLGVHLPTPELAVKLYLSIRGRIGAVHDIVSRDLIDGFDDNPLTADRERWELQQDFIAEEPRFGDVEVTVEWLKGALQLIARLWKRELLETLELPILLASSVNDELVLARRHERALKFLPDASIVRFDDAGHEILQETDAVRADFWKAFDRFLDRAGV